MWTLTFLAAVELRREQAVSNGTYGGSSGSGLNPEQRATVCDVNGLTDEQRARINQNRQIALERRAARQAEAAPVSGAATDAPVPEVLAVQADLEQPDFDADGFHRVLRPPLAKFGSVELYEFAHRVFPDGTKDAEDLAPYIEPFVLADPRGWTVALLDYGDRQPTNLPSPVALSFTFNGKHIQLLYNKLRVKLVVPAGIEVFKISMPRNPGRREASVLAFVKAVCDGGRNFAGTLGFKVSDDPQFDLDRVRSAVDGLSRSQYATMRTNATLVASKTRTPLQNALVRGGDRLEDAVFEEATAPAQVRLVASDPLLRPPSAFRWDTVITTYNDISGEYETSTLSEYRNNSQLHGYRGLVLLGAPGTCKTSILRALAGEFALRYSKEPPESCFFIESNTVDSLRKVQDRLQIGVPVIFDEFEPADEAQNVHMSPSILKLLVQPCCACTVRGRNDDVAMHRCWGILGKLREHRGLDWQARPQGQRPFSNQEANLLGSSGRNSGNCHGRSCGYALGFAACQEPR